MTPISMRIVRGLGLALCVSAMLAGPSMAQPSLEFNIGASVPSLAPDAPDIGGSMPDPGDDVVARRPAPEARVSDKCLSNRQVRRGLRAHDFDNIDIGRQLSGDAVEVMANYGGSLYRMSLDRCSGKVSNVERLRRNGLGGFGLQFGF